MTSTLNENKSQFNLFRGQLPSWDTQFHYTQIWLIPAVQPGSWMYSSRAFRISLVRTINTEDKRPRMITCCPVQVEDSSSWLAG